MVETIMGTPIVWTYRFTGRPDVWVADSAATVHVSPNRGDFTTYHKYPASQVIKAFGNNTVKAVGEGDIVADIEFQGKIARIQLTQVMHVPGTDGKILSLKVLDQKGFESRIIGCQVHIMKDAEVYTETSSGKELYKVTMKIVPPNLTEPDAGEARKRWPRSEVWATDHRRRSECISNKVLNTKVTSDTPEIETPKTHNDAVPSSNLEAKLEEISSGIHSSKEEVTSDTHQRKPKLSQSKHVTEDVLQRLQRLSDFKTCLDRLESMINDFELSLTEDMATPENTGIHSSEEEELKLKAKNVIEIVDARIEEELEELRLRASISEDVGTVEPASQPQPGPVSAQGDSVQFENTIWLTLAAWLLLFFKHSFYSFDQCCIRNRTLGPQEKCVGLLLDDCELVLDNDNKSYSDRECREADMKHMDNATRADRTREHVTACDSRPISWKLALLLALMAIITIRANLREGIAVKDITDAYGVDTNYTKNEQFNLMAYPRYSPTSLRYNSQEYSLIPKRFGLRGSVKKPYSHPNRQPKPPDSLAIQLTAQLATHTSKHLYYAMGHSLPPTDEPTATYGQANRPGWADVTIGWRGYCRHPCGNRQVHVATGMATATYGHTYERETWQHNGRMHSRRETTDTSTRTRTWTWLQDDKPSTEDAVPTRTPTHVMDWECRPTARDSMWDGTCEGEHGGTYRMQARRLFASMRGQARMIYSTSSLMAILPDIRLRSSIHPFALQCGFSLETTVNSFGRRHHGSFPRRDDHYIQTTDPIWIYCRQMNPDSHCAAGMVMAINPGDGQLATFHVAVKATRSNSMSTTAASSVALISTTATYRCLN